MSKAHGKNSYLAIGDADNADALTDISTYLNNAELARSRSTAESTGFSPTGSVRSYVAGLKDGTVSVSGVWDGAAAAIDVLLDALMDTDTPASWQLGPHGNGSGAVKYEGGPNGSGSAGEGLILTDYTISSPLDDVVAFDAEFQVTGRAIRGTFA